MALSKSRGLDNSQTSPFQLSYLLCGTPVIFKQAYYQLQKKIEKMKKDF